MIIAIQWLLMLGENSLHTFDIAIYVKSRLGFSIFDKSERKNHIKFKTKSKDLKGSCMYVSKQLHLRKRSNSP